MRFLCLHGLGTNSDVGRFVKRQYRIMLTFLDHESTNRYVIRILVQKKRMSKFCIL